MKTNSLVKLIAAAFLSVFMSTLATAQTDPVEPPQLDDATLNQFVTALDSVNEIQVEYSESLANAQDQAQAQTLQQEAQQKMVKAVEDAGLDVPTYNAIAQQVAADPALEQKVQSMLES